MNYKHANTMSILNEIDLFKTSSLVSKTMVTKILVFWDRWKNDDEEIAFSLVVDDDRLGDSVYYNNMYNHIKKQMNNYNLSDDDGGNNFVFKMSVLRNMMDAYRNGYLDDNLQSIASFGKNHSIDENWPLTIYVSVITSHNVAVN